MSPERDETASVRSRKPPKGRRGGGFLEGLKVWLPGALLLGAGFYVAYLFVEPGPPSRVTLATGSEEGAYHAFGQRMAEIIVRSGVEVDLRPSVGSLENVRWLAAGEVDLAYVQGGTVTPETAERLRGVASLYHEPLWVFLRSGLRVEQLSELSGRRLAVGVEGSGTRAVAETLLWANGVGSDDAEWLPLGSDAAIDGLLAHAVDAAFFVGSARSSAITRLMTHEGTDVTLLDIQRTLAYSRLFRHLSPVRLGQGAFDLIGDIPNRDIHLVAPTAALLTTEDLHPALIPLFIEAAREVHGQGDLFEETDEFPSPHGMEVELAESAAQYYEKGPSFLYRVLPFQVAAIVDRLKILLLPLITLLFPLMKVLPPIYRWRIRSKVYRWYKDLWDVEDRLQHAADDDELQAQLRELDRVGREIYATKVPPSYMEELYNLRMHLERVQKKIGRTAAP